jgi:hypothetical protein
VDVFYVRVDVGDMRAHDVQLLQVAPSTRIGIFKKLVKEVENLSVGVSQIEVYSMESWETRQKQDTVPQGQQQEAKAIDAATSSSAFASSDAVPLDLCKERYLVVAVTAGASHKNALCGEL